MEKSLVKRSYILCCLPCVINFKKFKIFISLTMDTYLRVVHSSDGNFCQS